MEFHDGLMLEFYAVLAFLMPHEKRASRPLVRQTENVFLRFFRFMNFAPAEVETPRLTNQNWCENWGWELVKAFAGKVKCGRGWLQVMSQLFIAWKLASERIFIAKAEIYSWAIFFRSRHRAWLSIELKHMRLRSALPFTGCLTFPEAWHNRTPDRIIDKTGNYPNSSSRSFSAKLLFN